MMREHMDQCPATRQSEHVVIELAEEPAMFVCDNDNCQWKNSTECAVLKMYA